jgi:hypothetical protein
MRNEDVRGWINRKCPPAITHCSLIIAHYSRRIKMKKVLWILAAIPMLLLAPCTLWTRTGGGNIAIDNLTKLQPILAAQSVNTAAAPYTVVLPNR